MVSPPAVKWGPRDPSWVFTDGEQQSELRKRPAPRPACWGFRRDLRQGRPEAGCGSCVKSPGPALGRETLSFLNPTLPLTPKGQGNLLLPLATQDAGVGPRGPVRPSLGSFLPRRGQQGPIHLGRWPSPCGHTPGHTLCTVCGGASHLCLLRSQDRGRDTGQKSTPRHCARGVGVGPGSCTLGAPVSTEDQLQARSQGPRWDAEGHEMKASHPPPAPDHLEPLASRSASQTLRGSRVGRPGRSRHPTSRGSPHPPGPLQTLAGRGQTCSKAAAPGQVGPPSSEAPLQHRAPVHHCRPPAPLGGARAGAVGTQGCLEAPGDTEPSAWPVLQRGGGARRPGPPPAASCCGGGTRLDQERS